MKTVVIRKCVYSPTLLQCVLSGIVAMRRHYLIKVVWIL